MQLIKGMDVSMQKSLEEQGAHYFLNGEEKDVIELLKECGTNLIRLRLWHDPYSESGVAYGGGNNDLETTVQLARRVVMNNMELLLDFHYSDFWADPSRQTKPKAWQNLTREQLERMVYKYTADTLRRFCAEGIVPGMIQIGNEITNGLLWPDGQADNVEGMANLLRAGIKGAREVVPDAKIVFHLDFGTDNKLYRKWFSNIEPYGLDYDVIGMSYYPHWNGGIEKLLYNMNDISSLCRKDVLVAETAIGYTTDPLGCTGIVFGKEQEAATQYPATFEGQEQFLRDLLSAVRKVKDGRGLGIIYWEPTWLPINSCTWADPLGREYMKDSVEPGNSMGNQALFDRNGNANQALLNLKFM